MGTFVSQVNDLWASAKRSLNGYQGVGDFSVTYSQVQKCPALLWPVSLGPRLQLGQRWPQVWGNQLCKKAKGTSWMFPSIIYVAFVPSVHWHNAALQKMQFCFLCQVTAACLVLTFPQHNPLVSRELGLDRLCRQILPALPQVPLGAPQASEPPEIGSVSAGGLGEGVLHAGQLLGSGRKTGTAGVKRSVWTESFLLLCITCCQDLAALIEEKQHKVTKVLFPLSAAPTMWALRLFDVE